MGHTVRQHRTDGSEGPRGLAWQIVLAVAVVALTLLGGCAPLDGPTMAETCRDVCGEAPVVAARMERTGPACECLAECAVRAAVKVTPVPPGPDGRERRGGRLAKAVTP